MIVPQMLPKDAIPLLNDPSWVWIDVREVEEYDYGHIPGSKNVPISQMRPNDFLSFSPEQKIMVVCRSGARSGRVVQALQEMGYVNSYNFSGGLIGYNMVAKDYIPVYSHTH